MPHLRGRSLLVGLVVATNVTTLTTMTTLAPFERRARADGATAAEPSAEPTAEPSAADKESARVVFGLALGLREQGKLREALEKFTLANALYSTPITALELGRTHLVLGELVAAHAAFVSVAKIPVRPSESEKSAEARREAEKLAAEVRPRLGELTVTIVGAAKGVVVTLTLDGVVVPAATTAAAQLVDPGKHVVSAHVDGRKDAVAEVTLAEAEHRAVTLALPPAPEPLPILAVLPPKDVGRTSPLVYLGFGVAGVGLVLGTVTGTIALSKASTVKGQCDGSVCPPEAAGDLDLSRRMGNVSTVSFVVGGVGAIIGVVGLFSSRGGGGSDAGEVDAAKGPTIQPTFGLGTVGAVGAF